MRKGRRWEWKRGWRWLRLFGGSPKGQRENCAREKSKGNAWKTISKVICVTRQTQKSFTLSLFIYFYEIRSEAKWLNSKVLSSSAVCSATQNPSNTNLQHSHSREKYCILGLLCSTNLCVFLCVIFRLVCIVYAAHSTTSSGIGFSFGASWAADKCKHRHSHTSIGITKATHLKHKHMCDRFGVGVGVRV